MRRFLQATAAWRISIWTTVAFAMGTAVAFSIVYFFVAKEIQERSDAWLRGEAEVLARVSADTPRDYLYNRIVGEVAELATQELPDERSASGQRLNSVFFLESDSENKESLLWVGPGSSRAFLDAIQATKLTPGVPQAILVEGWPTTFRVIARQENGQRIYLGLSSRGGAQLLRTLTLRFIVLWTSTVIMGFLISYLSAHRTLHRVQGITDAVAGIDSEDLGQRLRRPVNSDEISRLTEAFNHLLERIQTSVNELRSVTDTVAHDLRSPITSIRGTLESVLSTEPSEKWRESVSDAVEGLDRLLSALNTTLDVAEAQAGALRLERVMVDLSAVVKRLVDLYQPALDEQNHELKIDIENDITVDADVGLLNRVLSNLIENEIGHLPAGCQITIRLRARDGNAILEFNDNGPGFPPDMGTRAFKRFVKGRNSHGHGLGLAFVDAVVRAHGGTARISGNPTGGATVTLTLPKVAHESMGSELSEGEPNRSTPHVVG
jgi:signal transduction histidine kinase